MRISIFGIGHVGAVTAACLAESGHEVIAVDKDPAKLDALRAGRAPVAEMGLDLMIRKYVANGRLRVSDQAREAVLNSDFSLVCVGTPGDETGAPQLDDIEACCREIGAVLREKKNWHCVVVRSTLMPSSARQVILPLLEKTSGKKAGRDFGFGNNPEFLREGSAVHDYFHPPKIVIGTVDERTAQGVTALYKNIHVPLVVTDLDVAEAVKYADNAWHATKIGFANEIGNVLQAYDVDSHEVMEIFCLDTKLNISSAYLKPGFAFGGSCLPKDLRALQAGARQKNLKTPLFDAVLHANDEQISRAVRMIENAGRKQVGLVGLAFKPGTDDIRESPLLRLAEILLARGHDLKIYDPLARTGKREVNACMNELENVLTAGVVVIGHSYPELSALLKNIAPDVILIDLVGLSEDIRGRDNYQGICW